MKSFTKIAAISLLSLTFAGCSTTPFKHEVPGIQKSETVRLVDARPKTEGEQKIFSLLITSDAYALYRNGGQMIDPSALRLFQHKVYEKFASNDTPVEVKVYHFVSYMNLQSSSRKTAIFSALTGGIGGAIAASTQNTDADFKFKLVDRDKFESLSNDNEYTRALYAEDENPNSAPVFILYIDAEINGKRQFVRGVAPTTSKTSENAYVFAVNNTIKAFLDQY